MITAIMNEKGRSGRKTLVCVFLRGGADTLNMLVPLGDDDYYRLRPSIAIRQSPSQGAAIPLDHFYGFHPNLAPLVPAYREGRLAIVQGVGTDNPTGSHFDSQDQVEHGQAYGESLAGGWLGRYLSLRRDQPASVFSAVALGTAVPLTLAGAPVASAIESIDDVRMEVPKGSYNAMAGVLGAMYSVGGAVSGQPDGHLPKESSSCSVQLQRLDDSLARTGKQTLELLARVRTAQSDTYRPENSAEYPQDEFGAGVKEIARLIKSGLGLEAATIDLGGWDTHFFQGSSDGQQARLIDSLARALAAFDLDLARYREEVILLTLTEFGRRSYENGSLGTDHGRGFAMFVIGGGVRGGQVIGEWPGLKEEQPGPGPGGLRINHDYRSVLSEIVDLASNDLALPFLVFPGVNQCSLR